MASNVRLESLIAYLQSIPRRFKVPNLTSWRHASTLADQQPISRTGVHLSYILSLRLASYATTMSMRLLIFHPATLILALACLRHGVFHAIYYPYIAVTRLDFRLVHVSTIISPHPHKETSHRPEVPASVLVTGVFLTPHHYTCVV